MAATKNSLWAVSGLCHMMMTMRRTRMSRKRMQQCFWCLRTSTSFWPSPIPKGLPSASPSSPTVSDGMLCSLSVCFCLSLSVLSRSLADHWGTTVDFTTSFLHSLRFLAFRSSIFHSRPVHSLMLSFHCFLCLPLHLPPWTVPCRIVLASLDDCVVCLYHFSLRLFTVKSGLYTAQWRFQFWLSLCVLWL